MTPVFQRSLLLGAGGVFLLGALLWGEWPAGEPAPVLSGLQASASLPEASLPHAADLARAASPNAQPAADARRPLPADVGIQKLDTAAWLAQGGHPLLNADLIRIFEQISGRVQDHPERELAGRIPAEFLAQAQRLLAQYTQYRESLSLLRPADYGTQPSQMLEGILGARQNLQQQFFTAEEIDGLFGDDNRYDAFSVERLRISERDDLSTAQKAAMIAERSSVLLSPAQQEARETALLPTRILGQNASMDQAGVTPEQRQATRTTQFGAAAAGRMAEVDRQEAAWQQRIARLARADEATQQQMRKTEFTPAEQLRLDASLSLYRVGQQRLQTR